MKQFLIKTFGFLVAAMMIALAILLVPIDKRYQYAFVKTDCAAKSNYIYHRIYEDSTRLDVVFLGSSHTMCGVNDSIIQSRVDTAGKSLQVSNLGLCRLGRNMDYLILKDLLTRKKPKLLILEVKQEEPELSHPEFGYHADISDVVMPPSVIDSKYFTDLANAFTIRLNYIRDVTTGKVYDAHYEAPHLNFHGHDKIADTSILHAGARSRWDRYYSHPHSPAVDSLLMRYPKGYMTKIMTLAREHEIKVVMLYIPNYGYPWHKPKELAYYQQLGQVIMLPDSFYDNEQYWMEDEHLNTRGASILSDSIAKYIISHKP